MSIRINGSVEFLPNPDGIGNERFDRIYIYFSKHVPTLKYEGFNLRQYKGDFELRAPLTTSHPFGNKATDKSKIAIVLDSFIGFDVMINKNSDDLEYGDGVDKVCAGDYELGTSQLNLYSCYILQNHLKSRGLDWKLVSPSIPVIDEYSITEKFSRGVLVVRDLTIELDSAIFEGWQFRSLFPNHQTVNKEWEEDRMRSISTIMDMLIKPGKRWRDLVNDYVYKRYDDLDSMVIELANKSITKTFEEGSLRPAIDILKTVHCPYYKQARNFNLGPAYALCMPDERSDESFYEECIRITLRRHGIGEGWFLRVVNEQMSYPTSSTSIVPGFPLAYAMAGEALTVFATSCCYTDDVTMVPDQGRGGSGNLIPLKSDRYSDMRKLGTDDCEGMAREIIIEHRELLESRKAGVLKSDLVKGYADALRWSIPMLVHGIARTGASPHPGKYSRTAGRDEGRNEKNNGESYSIPSTNNPVTGKSPSMVSYPLPAFYANQAADAVRKTILTAMDKSTSAHTQKVVSAHCFVVLDTSHKFAEGLGQTTGGRDFLGSLHGSGKENFLLDPDRFVGEPAWVKMLPRLVLEGTNRVFPIQFPLGLLFEPGTKERSIMEKFQSNRKRLLKLLIQRVPEVAAMSIIKYGMSSTTDTGKVLTKKWNNVLKDFYWMAVAAYVPTPCPPVNPLPRDLGRDSRPIVFREIGFSNSSNNTYGVVIADMVMPQGKSGIAYTPTDQWHPKQSDLVTNQALTEPSIPPIKRKVTQEISQHQTKLATAFEEDLLAALPAKGKWIFLKRLTEGSLNGGQEQKIQEGQEQERQSIPVNSEFDVTTGNSMQIWFHLHEAHIISEYFRNICLKIIKNFKIRDIRVFPINLGAPMYQTKEGTYIYDLLMEVCI